MSKGTGCILSEIKERVFLKVNLTQLEIIEVKYLTKVSTRRADMCYTETR